MSVLYNSLGKILCRNFKDQNSLLTIFPVYFDIWPILGNLLIKNVILPLNIKKNSSKMTEP